jgi:DNA repair exonuclease SbcCD ATPase subunit
MGLLWTVAGVFVAALGVLFTVAAIAAGYLLWRQDRSHKAAIAAFMKEYREQLDQLTAATNARIDTVVAELKETMTAENEEAVQRMIADLQRVKLGLQAPASTSLLSAELRRILAQGAQRPPIDPPPAGTGNLFDISA